eukprot:3397369-Rhodomonas_salina.1
MTEPASTNGLKYLLSKTNRRAGRGQMEDNPEGSAGARDDSNVGWRLGSSVWVLSSKVCRLGFRLQGCRP